MTTKELQGEARFELKRQLADTLQGRIYSAIDRNTGNHVVVKETWKKLVLLGKSRDGHSVPENFEEEKKILKYLSQEKDAHSGFVRLIDEWEDKDCFLYAMEMCRGGELFEYIKTMHSDGAVAHFTRQQSRLQQKEMQDANEWIKKVQHMFHQLVSCMTWMHSKGVCHLDLSLENAMIGSRSTKHGNQIKIIDFGLARYYPNGKFTNNARVGKISYMAPEVFARKEYDPRSADVYSLGVMLFMMLIGAPAYQVPSPSNPAFNFIINGRLRDVLKHWKRLGCVTKDAIDLMDKIFKYEKERITLDEIIKHPFVANLESQKLQKESQSKPQQQQQQQPQLQPQKQPQTQTKTQQQQHQTKADINSYTFTSEIAKRFMKQLSSSKLQQNELADILKNVEQTHNSMQQKSKKQSGTNSESKLQQTMRELNIIHQNVEHRLAAENNVKHKVEIGRGSPHIH